MAQCLVRVLGRMGHQVSFLDARRFRPALDAIALAGSHERDTLRHALFRAAADWVKDQLLAMKPAAAVYLSQAPVLTDADVMAVRNAGTVCAYWFTEDQRHYPSWAAALGRYDYFWTVDPLQAAALAERAKVPAENQAAGDMATVSFFPPGIDTAVHFPGSETAADDNHVVDGVVNCAFVGAGYANRRDFVARFRQKMPLQVMGTFWGHDKPLAGALDHADVCEVYRRSLVLLNLPSFKNLEDPVPPTFANPRVFEICGCGGFQLVDERLPIAAHFEPGREVVTFDSVEDAVEKAGYYLTHPEQRRAIARAGYRRAMADHRYESRLTPLVAGLLARGT